MATITADPSPGARDYNRIRMAKKQNPESPAPASRRRTAKVPAPAQSLTPGVEQPPLSIAGSSISAANDSSTNGGTREPSYDDIAQAAYLRYLNRGGTHGSDFDDWVEAERDLRRKG